MSFLIIVNSELFQCALLYTGQSNLNLFTKFKSAIADSGRHLLIQAA